MKIRKNGDKLIVELDLVQGINNCYDPDEDSKTTDNLVGIIAGDEYTISQLNDLSYKGDQQEGPPLVHFYGEEDEFRKICGENGLMVWEHSVCKTCRGVIYGSFTLDDKGQDMCMDCYNKEKK